MIETKLSEIILIILKEILIFSIDFLFTHKLQSNCLCLTLLKINKILPVSMSHISEIGQNTLGSLGILKLMFKINFKIMYCNFCLIVIIVIQLFHNVNWTKTITNLPWPKMHCWLIYIITLSILDWLVNMVNSHLVISYWNRLLLFFDTASCTS